MHGNNVFDVSGDAQEYISITLTVLSKGVTTYAIHAKLGRGEADVWPKWCIYFPDDAHMSPNWFPYSDLNSN